MAKKKEDPASRPDPKAEERKRLKSLAFSRRLLSRGPSSGAATLRPSNTVLKLQGADVVKKGQRKNRFLFSFPGFIAPVAGGGKIGELADLASGNPTLYFEFPQGRMKLFGTIVYPKNRYLTLQFARKNVLCEDSFDNMIVFSDAWWIGKKEENPEELQLKFPKELSKRKCEEYDFRGGAGAPVGERPSGGRHVKESADQFSPEIELKDDVSENSDNHVTLNTPPKLQVTPARQSARISGKTLNYADASSGDDSDTDTTDSIHENENVHNDCPTKESTENSDQEIPSNISGRKLVTKEDQSVEDVMQTPISSKKVGAKSPHKRSALVQATLSSLFEKASEKISKDFVGNFPESKGSSSKRKRAPSKFASGITTGSGKKKAQSLGKKSEGKGQGKQKKVQDDDIEDISSEDIDDSDED